SIWPSEACSAALPPLTSHTTPGVPVTSPRSVEPCGARLSACGNPLLRRYRTVAVSVHVPMSLLLVIRHYLHWKHLVHPDQPVHHRMLIQQMVFQLPPFSHPLTLIVVR